MQQLEMFRDVSHQQSPKTQIIWELINLQDQLNSWTHLYSLLQFTEYCLHGKQLEGQQLDESNNINLDWFVRNIYICDKIDVIQNSLRPQYFFNSYVDFNIPLLDVNGYFDYIKMNVQGFFVNNTNRLWIFQSKINFVALKNITTNEIICQQEINESISDNMNIAGVYDVILITSEEVPDILQHKLRCFSCHRKISNETPQSLQFKCPKYLVTLYIYGIKVINLEQCTNLVNMSTQNVQHNYNKIIWLTKLQRIFSFDDYCIECPNEKSFIDALQNSKGLKYIQIIYPGEGMLLPEQKIAFHLPQLKFITIFGRKQKQKYMLLLKQSNLEKLEVINLNNCEYRYLDEPPNNLLDVAYLQHRYNSDLVKKQLIQNNIRIKIADKYFNQQVNDKKSIIIGTLYKQLSKQQDCAIYRYNTLKLIDKIMNLNEHEFQLYYVDYFNNITHHSNQIICNDYIESEQRYKYYTLIAPYLDYCELNFVFNIDFRIIDFDSSEIQKIFNGCYDRIWHINSKINIACLNEVQTQTAILQRYIRPDIFDQYRDGKLYDIIILTRNNIDLYGISIRSLIYQRQIEYYELKIYKPTYLVSISLKQVKILNMSECVNLQNIYSENNTYYEHDFISLTSIKRLSSFYDNFEIIGQYTNMISTLVNCKGIIFIQIYYPGYNIVQTGRAFSLNMAHLKYFSVIFMQDQKENQLIIDLSQSNIGQIQELEVINGDLFYTGGKRPNTYLNSILNEKSAYLVNKHQNKQYKKFYQYFSNLLGLSIFSLKQNILLELYTYFMANISAQQRYNIYSLINNIFNAEENQIKQVFQIDNFFEIKRKLRHMIIQDQYIPFQQQKNYYSLEIDVIDQQYQSQIMQEKINSKYMYDSLVPFYQTNLSTLNTDGIQITYNNIKQFFQNCIHQLPIIQQSSYNDTLELIAIRDVLTDEISFTSEPNEIFFDKFIQRVSLYDVLIITSSKMIMSFQELRIRYLNYQVKNPAGVINFLNLSSNCIFLKYPQFLETAYFMNIKPINLLKAFNLKKLATQQIRLQSLSGLQNVTHFYSVNDDFVKQYMIGESSIQDINTLFLSMPSLEYFHIVSRHPENVISNQITTIEAPLHKLQWLIVHLENDAVQLPVILKFDVQKTGLEALKLVELKTKGQNLIKLQFINGEPPILI